MRRLIVCAAFAAALLMGPSVVAQVGEAVSIDSALCVVEPMSVDDLVALIPTGTPAPRTNTGADFVPPTGTPADAETATAVSEFVYELSACNQAGNILAVFALQSDAYTKGTLSRMGMTEAQVQQLVGTGDPVNTGNQNVTTINDIVVLDDGRIGVAVTEVVTNPSGLVETFDMYYTLVESETAGQYLLDEYVLVSVV